MSEKKETCGKERVNEVTEKKDPIEIMEDCDRELCKTAFLKLACQAFGDNTDDCLDDDLSSEAFCGMVFILNDIAGMLKTAKDYIGALTED